MGVDEAQLEPACDPEQAGIIVDRLATELERAELANPQAVPGLQEDARELLAYLEAWLAREPSELAAGVQNISQSGDIDVLVRNLRQLAEQLLELADRQIGKQETSGSDFDPQGMAGALRVLETEVGPELLGEDAQWALIALRSELGNVVERARAWAERTGFAADAIPTAPAASAGPQDCMSMLRHLAGVLEDLGLQAAKARNGSS